MDPYENLANAIIKQAADDYRKALKALSLNSRNKEAQATVKECEDFFRSDWYKQLTSLDGEYLIRKLKEEVDI